MTLLMDCIEKIMKYKIKSFPKFSNFQAENRENVAANNSLSLKIRNIDK